MKNTNCPPLLDVLVINVLRELHAFDGKTFVFLHACISLNFVRNGNVIARLRLHQGQIPRSIFCLVFSRAI